MKKFFPLLLILAWVFANGQNIPKPPNPPRLVNDFTNTLSAGQINELEQKLVSFDNQTTNQIAVVIVSTFDGYDPADYALKLGREWQIGNKKTNNGVLFVIAKDDRKLNISPGPGLEGALPDITASQIIRNDITPSFKAGNYYQGISNGVESIMKATQGEYKADSKYANRGRSSGGGGWFMVIVVIVILLFIFGRRGGGRGGGMMSRRGYGGFSSPLWWLPLGGGGGGGGSSGGFGGGGGGGFGGFGGGSFGGGGSSGSW